MRLIPKKSKVNSTIWKSFTLLDFVLIFLLLVLAVVIALSNIPSKWYILLAYFPICVLLFVPDGDGGRAYSEIIHIVKFIFSRKKYSADTKSKSKSVNALIPPFTITDDGLLDYGEYCGCVIEIGSVEFALKSEFQQNEIISAFANVFNSLSANEFAQLVKIDRPINFDEIAELTFSKLKKAEEPPKKLIMRSRLQQLDSLNNVEHCYRPYHYLVLYSQTRQTLEALSDAILPTLSDVCGLSARRLTQSQTAVFLKYCFTRDFDEREIKSIPPENYLDYIRPHDVQFRLADHTIDGKYSFTYAISDYPLAVGNAWGANLFDIPNTKAVLNIRPVDREKAIKRIDRTIVEIGTRENNTKASEMIAQDTHISTMGALLQSLQNENEGLFDCTLTITGYNNDGENNAAFRKRVRQQIVTQGFKVSMLRGRQLDGFIASSITARTPLKKFSRGINSESLAAVFPFVFTSVIEPKGVTLGESNGYPFIFDPFKWEYSGGEYVNANMFIAGTSGSGKSYFAKSLLSALYSENAVIYILDPENEYKHLCHNVGGRFIDVGTALSGRINPFHVYAVLTDNGTPAPPEVTYAAHLQYLDNFFKVTLPGIPQDTLEEINNLVSVVYEKCGITQNTDCTELPPEAFPTFDLLYDVVEKELKTVTASNKVNNLQRALTYLAKFKTGGRFANLWNGPSTLSSSDRLTVFNFQSLFESKNQITSQGQMLTVLRFLEQQIINLKELNTGKPREKLLRPIVVLDEGYMFIDGKNTYALDFVYQWYKRIRKYSGSMIFLTQNLADIVGNSEIISKTSAIINNTQYSFIMTLQGKDIEVLQDVFASRNLTSAEIEEIQRTNKPKGTAFFMGSSAQRAMLHVVTANEVETMFSRDIDDLSTLLDPPIPISNDEQSDLFEQNSEEDTEENH